MSYKTLQEPSGARDPPLAQGEGVGGEVNLSLEGLRTATYSLNHLSGLLRTLCGLCPQSVRSR